MTVLLIPLCLFGGRTSRPATAFRKVIGYLVKKFVDQISYLKKKCLKSEPVSIDYLFTIIFKWLQLFDTFTLLLSLPAYEISYQTTIAVAKHMAREKKLKTERLPVRSLMSESRCTLAI
jgi:hypothetical protein